MRYIKPLEAYAETVASRIVRKNLSRTYLRTYKGSMARAPNEAEFGAMNLFGLCVRFYNNREETIRWCRENGLLAREMHCATCGSLCTETIGRREVDGRVWRCSEGGCRRRINIRKGSFFEGSHLQLWQVLCLTYFWSIDCGRSRGLSQQQIMKELEIGCNSTIVDWKQFCRDVCVSYFLNHPEQIGGEDRVVEIDESLFARRKYNRGRIVAEQWIFGGYDPVAKKGFLVPVPRRDAATLLPIVQQWVLPGITVYSDMWQAYNQLGAIGYGHGTVNHTLHFVDPATGVTTNHVEAMWQRAKNKHKAHHGPTNRDMIPDYCAEFMWYERFGDNTFYHFWHQVATDLYVV